MAIDVVTKRITLWQNIRIPIGETMMLPDWLAKQLMVRGLVDPLQIELKPDPPKSSPKKKIK